MDKAKKVAESQPQETEVSVQSETQTPANDIEAETLQENKQSENNTLPPPIPVVTYRVEMDKDAPHEERIIGFLKSRGANDFVPINDFLKSLFPLPLPGTQPEWKRQERSKYLKGLLSRMVEAGQIKIKSDHYKELGRHYYPDGQIETRYKDISNMLIEAKLA